MIERDSHSNQSYDRAEIGLLNLDFKQEEKMIRKMMLCVCMLLSVWMLRGEVGVKAGIEMSNFSLSKDIANTEFNSRKSLKLGAFASIGLTGGLSLQPEFYYTQKGTEVREGTVLALYKLSYMEFPVLLKYRFPSTGRSLFSLFTGPYYALNTTASGELKINGEDRGGIPDLKENVAGSDYGLVIGGEFGYRLGKGRLILDLRFSLGLMNIGKNVRQISGDLDYDDTVKNRSISFTIGYAF